MCAINGGLTAGARRRERKISAVRIRRRSRTERARPLRLRFQLHPAQAAAGGFGLAIVVGAAMLMLPVSKLGPGGATYHLILPSHPCRPGPSFVKAGRPVFKPCARSNADTSA